MLNKCFVCEKPATFKTIDKFNVCFRHKNYTPEKIKCSCGKMFEFKISKFGPYYNCIKCGNYSVLKARLHGTILETKE